jgi:SAM-dependent methyltransferase
MPLTHYIAQNIAEITFRNNLAGRILHFGRLYPNIDVKYTSIRSILESAGKPVTFKMHRNEFELIGHEDVFFKSIGYDDEESLDVSDYESPTHVFDLNDPNLPENLVQRFDVIYNNGTLEHIFNVPNCLSNITKMLKNGGHVIHTLPSNNHFNHGFYQFSPCLLFDYYEFNKFKIKESKIYRRNSKFEDSLGEIWGGNFYNPYVFENAQHYDGKLDGGVYTHYFVAQKTDDSKIGAEPIQGCYRTVVKNSYEKMFAERQVQFEKMENRYKAQIESDQRLIESLQTLLNAKRKTETELYRQLLDHQITDRDS